MTRSGGKSSAKPVASRAAPAAGRNAHDEIHPVRQLNVLVVDDDAVDRMTVTRALTSSKLNPKITEVGDIASGLEIIRRNPVDVVLLDHILPDGKSPDFLRRLRDASLRLPVVITTGYGDEMLVADLLKSGAADYLPKDKISTESLTRAISHAVRVHKAEEELQKRDALLAASVNAANLLQSNDDRLSVISSTLAVLGRALAADRLIVFELHAVAGTKDPSFSHRFEWERQPDESKFNDPYLQNITFAGLGIVRWHSVIASGHVVSGPIASFPPDERKAFEARGIRSLMIVPVLVEERCWGFVQIEDRRTDRTWSDSEKTLLKSLAAGLGNRLMHRRADEVLRQSEERYRSIVEDQTDPVSRVLPDGTITFANAAYCRAVGRPREELVGKTIYQVYPEYLHDSMRAQLSGLSAQVPSNTHVYRYVAPDGHVIFMEWSARAVFNARGQLVEYQGAGRDITLQKEAEGALRASESRYRALVENIPAISYTAALDDTNTTQYISPQVQAITGFTPADYRANPNLWVERLHPEDRERVLAELKRCVSVRVPFICEYRMVSKSGQTLWILDQASVLTNAEGVPSLLQGVLYDISDRRRAEAALRESEEKYRSLVENINVGVFRNTGKPNGRFLQINLAHARILGYDNIEEVMGIRIEDLYHVPAERKLILEELKNWGFVRNREIHLKKKDGTPIWVSLSARATLDKDGRIDHVDGVIEDITERKKAEQALLESKDYLNKIINSIGDPMFVKDQEHRFVLVNDAECVLAGRPREDMIGKTDKDFFPGEQVEVFWKYDQQVLETGEESTNEECVTDARGNLRTIVTKKTRYVDASGRRFIVGVVRDITDRKTTEQALRESEQRYRGLTESSPDAIYLCAPDGRILFANRAAGEMLKMNPTAIAGSAQEKLFKSEDAKRHIATIRRICESGEPYTTETPEKLRNSEIWVDTRLVPLKDAQGQVTAVLGISRDISQRKRIEAALRESEENFKAVAENALDGIVVVDESGKVLYANRCLAEMAGFTSDEVLSKCINDLAHPDERERVNHFAKARANGMSAPSRYESVVVGKNGDPIPVEVSATRTTWRGKSASLGIMRDIREQKMIEEERRQLASSLMEVQEEERKKISSMLHDHLGQLLTLSRLELGSIQVADDKSKASIDNALQRLDEALNSVRRLAVSLRPPILDDLGIEIALETLTEEFGDYPDIQTSFRKQGPPFKLGDAEETCLYRVLQEALTNAAKHSGATKIDVQLQTDDRHVCLEVRDNGKGFDRHSAAARRGIGFIGMQERLRRCNGTFEIESETGKGTTLRAAVPLHPATTHEAPP